jgi:hypothetical protein
MANYLLNFSLENKKVKMNYLGSELAYFDENGVHLNNQEDSWGDHVYLEALTYGCDIYVN